MSDWQDRLTQELFIHHRDSETEQTLLDMHLGTLGAVWEFVSHADSDHDALTGAILAVASYIRRHPEIPLPDRSDLSDVEDLTRVTTDDLVSLDRTIHLQEQELARAKERREEAIEMLLNLMALSRGLSRRDGAHAALLEQL